MGERRDFFGFLHPIRFAGGCLIGAWRTVPEYRDCHEVRGADNASGESRSSSRFRRELKVVDLLRTSYAKPGLFTRRRSGPVSQIREGANLYENAPVRLPYVSGASPALPSRGASGALRRFLSRPPRLP